MKITIYLKYCLTLLFLLSQVQAGYCDTAHVLKVILAMKDENNYSVWFNIGKCLFKLRVLISNTDYLDSFKKFGRDLFKPVSQRLGWDPKPDESKNLLLFEIKTLY